MTIPHRVKTLWNNVTIFMKSEFNHEERVDKVVSAVLDEMGYLWDEVADREYEYWRVPYVASEFHGLGLVYWV